MQRYQNELRFKDVWIIFLEMKRKAAYIINIDENDKNQDNLGCLLHQK